MSGGFAQRRERTGRERSTTGIAGLDPILGGGLLRGGLYVLSGDPGTGKTVLANQICFHHAKRGESAVYVTALAESHERMLAHVQSFEFFDRASIATAISYVSGYAALEQSGLRGVLDLLRECQNKIEARMIVLDSLAALQESTQSTLELRVFLRELATLASFTDVIVVMLGPTVTSSSDPVHVTADGIFLVRRAIMGLRETRHLEVAKMRGGPSLSGQHLIRIGADGISVFPRLEALAEASRPTPVLDDRGDRLATGITALDEMLRGGLRRSSSTVLLGATGTGKTLLGTQFLVHGARAREPSLYFGLHESPAELVEKAERVGLPVQRLIDRGLLHTDWVASSEEDLDPVAHRLLDIVDERRVKRLFLDGLNALHQMALQRERLGRFMTAFMRELARRGVTTMASLGTDLQTEETPHAALSGSFSNVISLAFTQHHAQRERLISIVKIGDNDHDATIRRLVIDGRGLHVEEAFEGSHP